MKDGYEKTDLQGRLFSASPVSGRLVRPRGFGAFGSLCVYASHVRLPKTSGPHAQEARPAAFLWQAGGNSRGFQAGGPFGSRQAQVR